MKKEMSESSLLFFTPNSENIKNICSLIKIQGEDVCKNQISKATITSYLQSFDFVIMQSTPRSSFGSKRKGMSEHV